MIPNPVNDGKTVIIAAAEETAMWQNHSHTNSPAATIVQQSSRVLENEYVGVSEIIHKYE